MDDDKAPAPPKIGVLHGEALQALMDSDFIHNYPKDSIDKLVVCMRETRRLQAAKKVAAQLREAKVKSKPRAKKGGGEETKTATIAPTQIPLFPTKEAA